MQQHGATATTVAAPTTHHLMAMAGAKGNIIRQFLESRHLDGRGLAGPTVLVSQVVPLFQATCNSSQVQ